VSVWLYGDDRSTIRCIDLYNMSTDSHSEGMVLAATDYPSYFKALEEGAFIAAHDAHKDPRTNEFSDSYLSRLGITSMLDVPIRLKGEVMGIVCYEHVGPARRWTMEEENFARSLEYEGRRSFPFERVLLKRDVTPDHHTRDDRWGLFKMVARVQQF